MQRSKYLHQDKKNDLDPAGPSFANAGKNSADLFRSIPKEMLQEADDYQKNLALQMKSPGSQWQAALWSNRFEGFRKGVCRIE